MESNPAYSISITKMSYGWEIVAKDEDGAESKAILYNEDLTGVGEIIGTLLRILKDDLEIIPYVG